MLDPNDDMIFTIEDMRGVTVDVGDTIIRGVTVGKTACTRFGRIKSIKRTPREHGRPSYSMQVEWLLGSDYYTPEKPTTVLVLPAQNNDFFKVDFPEFNK